MNDEYMKAIDKTRKDLDAMRDQAALKAAPEIQASSFTFGRIVRDTFNTGFDLGFEAGLKVAENIVAQQKAAIVAKGKVQ